MRAYENPDKDEVKQCLHDLRTLTTLSKIGSRKGMPRRLNLFLKQPQSKRKARPNVDKPSGIFILYLYESCPALMRERKIQSPAPSA